MSNNETPITDIEPSLEVLAQEQNIYSDKPFKAEDSLLSDKGLSRGSIIMDVVRQLKTGADLYRISLPAALLAPISMLEFISYFVRPNPQVLSAHKHIDPEQRFIAILKWWLSNTSHTPRTGFMQAKPYNPIIGEVYCCKWLHKDTNDEISKTIFISEQVSHHPPIAACYMLNKKKNLELQAVLKPKSKFQINNVSTVLDGSITVKFLNYENEIYHIEFPCVVAKGLIWGNQCIEINEDLKISCPSTGYSCKIQFKSGSNNEVKGSIKKDGNRLYKISGSITDQVFIKSIKTKKQSTFLDIKESEVNQQNTNINTWFNKKVVDQKSNESRRVWHKVTKALHDNNYDDANIQKVLIEEKQRKLRKEREENGSHFQLDLFAIKEGTEDDFVFRVGLDKDLEEEVEYLQVNEDEKQVIQKM
ncbi:hypothetical protein ABK040_007034 [Willaertia magna]